MLIEVFGLPQLIKHDQGVLNQKIVNAVRQSPHMGLVPNEEVLYHFTTSAFHPTSIVVPQVVVKVSGVSTPSMKMTDNAKRAQEAFMMDIAEAVGAAGIAAKQIEVLVPPYIGVDASHVWQRNLQPVSIQIRKKAGGGLKFTYDDMDFTVLVAADLMGSYNPVIMHVMPISGSDKMRTIHAERYRKGVKMESHFVDYDSGFYESADAFDLIDEETVNGFMPGQTIEFAYEGDINNFRESLTWQSHAA